jgi:NADPH-dependent glutamate synthase beta subunit-like oxidoreductase
LKDILEKTKNVGKSVAIIGGGPAGLMAAQHALGGAQVFTGWQGWVEFDAF